MAKNTTPKEDQECITFSQWLSFNNLRHAHIPNENTVRHMGLAMKRKRMGVSKGFPDYIILMDKEQSRLNKPLMFFIEMKRQKGSRTSPEQVEWIKALDKMKGTGCGICKGADDAIYFISKYLR